MPAVARLGPFELDRPIARGGMADVWRAVHPATSLGVAVKVLRPPARADSGWRAMFRREVQAVAGLDHPAIVMVFDQGEVDEDAARASGGRLVAGSPYLVMELASGGSLRQAMGDGRGTGWPEVRAVLLCVLDALAHAHARGVVHRDIKPGNLLRCTSADPRPGLKLTDFGIASTADEAAEGAGSAAAGTMHYIAPEQLLCLDREQGPWTDLYSVGCLGWQLAAGHPPFAGVVGRALARAQIEQAPSALVPLMPVPSGFSAWLRALLAKSPSRRPRTAADAARLLAALGDAPRRARRGVSSSRPRGFERVPLITDPAVFETQCSTLVAVDPEARPPGLHAALGAAPALHPPVPGTWRRPEAPRLPDAMVGAGLSLYGLRTVRFVGRVAERDALWRALDEVHASGTARLRIVRGVRGVGKTRLVDVIAQRADELGLAEVCVAHHAPGEDPAAALRRMIGAHLKCLGLSLDEVEERIATLASRREGDADPLALAALAEFLCPGERSGAAERAAAERVAVVERFLRDAARRRPLVVVLDDVQWGAESLALAMRVLDGQRYSPSSILFLATVADEDLDDRPRERSQLESLLERPAVGEVHVDRLSPSETATLLRDLLHLDLTLAARLEKRVAGNPQVAVQLVGEWVERGLLSMGPDGFVLAAGVVMELPQDMREVWLRRIEGALRGLSEVARHDAERAAALGRWVDAGEWAAICGASSDRDRAVLLERLVAHQLAVESPGGWRFTQGIVLDALEHQAREGGRWVGHHRTCAAMLRARIRGQDGQAAAAPIPESDAERLGRHLLVAGELDACIGQLLAGARVQEVTGRESMALDLLAQCEAALERLGAGEDDPRWCQVRLRRAELLALVGEAHAALRLVRRAVDAARRQGWRSLVHRCLDAERRVAFYNLDDLDRADAILAELVASVRPDDDPLVVADCLRARGVHAGRRGDLGEGYRHAEQAAAMYEAMGHDVRYARTVRDLASYARGLGDMELAKRHWALAFTLEQRLGSRFGMGACLCDFGAEASQRGDRVEARRCYERALELFDAAGTWVVAVPRINLAFMAIDREEWDHAAGELERALHELRGGTLGYRAAAHAGLLVCCAANRDWLGWDRHSASLSELARNPEAIVEELAVAAEKAATLTAGAGEPARARSAWRLAARAWAVLGDEGRAAAAMEQRRAPGPPRG